MIVKHFEKEILDWYYRVAELPAANYYIERFEKGYITLHELYTELRSIEASNIEAGVVCSNSKPYKNPENVVSDDIVVATSDLKTFLFIAEGDGSNLTDEDMAAGYKDYIYSELYGRSEDCIGGGIQLLTDDFRNLYPSTLDAIEETVKFCDEDLSAEAKEEFMNLTPNTPGNKFICVLGKNCNNIANVIKSTEIKDYTGNGPVIVTDSCADGGEYIRNLLLFNKVKRMMYEAPFSLLEKITKDKIPDTDDQSFIEELVDEFLKKEFSDEPDSPGDLDRINEILSILEN